MATILFYSPFNNRSRDTESLMLAFKAKGHFIISLSQADGNFIHPFLNENGIRTQSFVLTGSKDLWYHFRHLIYFIWFCWRNKIDIVYSHLESSNYVASLAQYFIRSRVYLCRHHGNMFEFENAKQGFTHLLPYKLAKRIIVVSSATKEYMIQKEGIRGSKICVIPLAYDFSLYHSINISFVENFKQEVLAELVLISVGQLIPIKRPDISIYVLEKLIKSGVNAKLLLLGVGQMEGQCKVLTKNLGLEDRVIFTGYVQNVLDYIFLADLLLHPSISESSCVVIKEAALLDKPVIVCKTVGDFDDYIVDGVNGYLVDSTNFVEKSTNIILNGRDKYFGLKESLKAEVVRLFNIESVVALYEDLNRI